MKKDQAPDLVSVPVSRLIPADWNYKGKGTEQAREKLRASIAKDKTAGVLAVREMGAGVLEVIDGNHRLEAIRSLGWEKVSVENFGKLTQAEAVTIARRRNYQWFEDKEGALETLLRDVVLAEIKPEDLAEYMPDSFEDLQKILANDGGQDPDKILTPSKNPKAKRGELYALGDHRLLCGDATNPKDVARILKGFEPVLMVTDPPFGVSYDPMWRVGAGRKVRAAGKIENDDRADWRAAFKLFPGDVAYIWYADKFGGILQASLEEISFDVRAQIIWAKQHLVFGRGDYHFQHEPCLYAVRKGGRSNWQGSRSQTTLWEITNLNAFGGDLEKEEKNSHGTQKPLEAMARPIRNNTREGQVVYDPFVGSGTTIAAAEKLGRVALGIDIDPAYIDLSIERWEKLSGKKARKL